MIKLKRSFLDPDDREAVGARVGHVLPVIAHAEGQASQRPASGNMEAVKWRL